MAGLIREIQSGLRAREGHKYTVYKSGNCKREPVLTRPAKLPQAKLDGDRNAAIHSGARADGIPGR